MHTQAPDPLPLREVEPKRGRGPAKFTIRAIYIGAIRPYPRPYGRLLALCLVHGRLTAPPVANECTSRRSGSATICSN